jgi:hypothetical protein
MGTKFDMCDSNKGSSKHHTACCADNGGIYCHECPMNSCKWTGKMNKGEKVFDGCYDGATTNEECLCDVNFNYDKEAFKVCMGTTDKPTRKPTSSPSKRPTPQPSAAPTKPPSKDKTYCASGQYYFGKNKNEKTCGNNGLKWIKSTMTLAECPGAPVKGNPKSSTKVMCSESDFQMNKYFKDIPGYDSAQYCDKDTPTGNCCSGLMTHAEAQAFCSINGGRLCRNYEIENMCIARTGCDYDYSWVWGDQRCTTRDGEPGWMAGPGDQEKWMNLGSDCDTYTHCARSGNKNEGGVGMPNKAHNDGEGDWIHKENGGVTTFFGVAGTITEDWIEKASDRYDYLEAMADLFLWSGTGTVDMTQGVGTRSPSRNGGKDDRPDPRYDQGRPARTVAIKKWELRTTTNYAGYGGMVCVPDNQADIKLFVRCCGDQTSEKCVDCPAGRTNAAGNAKNYDDCVCESGAAFNEIGECD